MIALLKTLLGVAAPIPAVATDEFKLVEYACPDGRGWEAWQWHERPDGTGEWRQLPLIVGGIWSACDAPRHTRAAAEFAVKQARENLGAGEFVQEIAL